jgi:hypothetical protein
MEPLRYKALSQLDELKEAHAHTLKSSVSYCTVCQANYTLVSVTHTNELLNKPYLCSMWLF